MSYSLSNVQSQQGNPIGNPHPRHGGYMENQLTLNITYDRTNADGSIDRITRQGIYAFCKTDPGACVTLSEQLDRGLAPQTNPNRRIYAAVIKSDPLRASNLVIQIQNQQQIINNYQQTINQLNAQVQSLIQNIKALKAANTDLKAMQASLKQQIDQLRAQIVAKDAEIATIPGLKAQIDSQTTQITMLTNLIQFIFQ